MQALARQSGGEPRPGREFSLNLSPLHEKGCATIHLLAGLGYERAVDTLLEAGADLSAKVSPSSSHCPPGGEEGALVDTAQCEQDAWGYTPLHYAAARGKAEAVALLLAKQASTEAVTFVSETQPRLTPADSAAQAGHRGIAAFLSEEHLMQGVLKLSNAAEGEALPPATNGLRLPTLLSKLMRSCRGGAHAKKALAAVAASCAGPARCSAATPRRLGASIPPGDPGFQ